MSGTRRESHLIWKNENPSEECYAMADELLRNSCLTPRLHVDTVSRRRVDRLVNDRAD